MIKLLDLLRENTNSKYEFGCVMVYVNIPEINQIQSKIKPEDIHNGIGDLKYGLEDEPHITLLYGLHPEVTLNQIKQIISSFTWGPKPLVGYNVSLFENEDYDVLKFDVKGDILFGINKELVDLPHTTNFPNYHPHMTIGYLKKGQGKKYVDMFKNLKYELIPEYVIYSQPNGDKNKIKINSKYE